MTKKIILVDMDGVIADFEQGFLHEWKKKFPHHPYIPLEKRKTCRIIDDYSNELGKDVESIYTAPGFFYSLPPIEGAKEALIKMQQSAHDVFICTKSISNFENCILEKYQWIAQHLGYEWTKKIIVARDKTLIYADFLIDDKSEITGLKKPYWKYVLFDKPYNRNVNTEPRITWETWEKILEQPAN